MPFYVAAPTTTIDLACPDGGAIPIEERGAAEVLSFAGQSIAPPGVGGALRRLRRDAGPLHHGDRDGPRRLPAAVLESLRAAAETGGSGTVWPPA